jgi:hypothetical protein
MSELGPVPESARRPPVPRLWLVSLLLYACGFVGKWVMERGGGPVEGYPVVMLWQMGWYAAGLMTWWAWWNTRSGKGKAGCWVGIVLTIAAVFAAMSSSPH